jgi:hypothetical protein
MNEVKLMQAETSGRDWAAIFNCYEHSGLSQRQFCAQEGIEFYKFKYHRTQYLKQKTDVASVVPIRVTPSTYYGIELRLPQGVVVKLNDNIGVDYVKRLLSIL